MHHANNVVIMQTEQLGHIEALEEELRSSRVKMVEMEQKMTEQDCIIAQLVGDNFDHLQDNMRLGLWTIIDHICRPGLWTMFADWVHGPYLMDYIHQPCLPTMSTTHVS